MLKNKDMQLSIYSVLYNKIPKNHTLKILRDEVDFSFINKRLEQTYCKRYGRPAKEPELMVKLLVLQYLYDLRSEEHTSELQSRGHLVCRLLLEKKKITRL